MTDLLRDAIAEIDDLAVDPSLMHRISPAGLLIETKFDASALATSYIGRFNHGPASNFAATVSVLTGCRNELPLMWDDASFQPADFHNRLNTAGLRAAYPFRDGIWQLFDLHTRVGLQWCATSEALPPWDASAPLRLHLHWILREVQMRLAHAATLGMNGRGIVIFGRGGTGKSGTTLAGLAAGLATVGDDYVALGNYPTPCAKALYRPIKQDRHGLSRIPGLAERTADLPVNWRGKVEFDPSVYFEDAVVDAMRIKAAVLPRIAGVEKPVLNPVRPQSVMLALMTSNLHQFAGEPENGMQFFAEFLRDMPCFQLDLSPDAVMNGSLLREFIEKLPK